MSEKDIVERLRNYATCTDSDVDEAADTIERQRELLKTLEFSANGYCPACDGWMADPWRGATPGKHTKDCTLASAIRNLKVGG